MYGPDVGFAKRQFRGDRRELAGTRRRRPEGTAEDVGHTGDPRPHHYTG